MKVTLNEKNNFVIECNNKDDYYVISNSLFSFAYSRLNEAKTLLTLYKMGYTECNDDIIKNYREYKKIYDIWKNEL